MKPRYLLGVCTNPVNPGYKDQLVDMGIEAEEAEDNIATLANPEALAHFRDRQELTGRINMENYLAQLGAWVTVVQGAIFVVCVLAFRHGVGGEPGRILKKSL